MASEQRIIPGRALVPGRASGTALVLTDGLSFAMAFDVASGDISDVHSRHAGSSATGRVLVMPAGRGSSSASTALAEAIRLGTAPAAIVLREVDGILAVGAIVARTLYGRTCPIVVIDADDSAALRDGDRIALDTDGAVTVTRP